MKPSQPALTSFDPKSPSVTRRRTRAAAPRRPARGRAMVEALEERQLLTTLPSGFTESRVGTFAFTSPTAMAMAPDGRIFVAEQAGQLMVVKDGQLLDTPFVTVNTTDENERGLFGVVLDPNFETNGFVYVTYTNLEGTIHTRLSRFTAAGDVAAPGSETVIFETGPMTVSIHNSGALHFGPDGKLYMTVGENGGGPAAGVLTSYKGKMMRINPDGTIPTDNPFYNQTTGIQQAIYAYGFRNSFSFAIQPGTGRIFANDVGTNVWEEVNDVVAGGNYGYPEVEGPTNDPRFVSPVYSYQHSPGCAIVGGDFYNPATATFPADYVGDYFFGDLCDRTITRLDPDTHEATVFAQFTRGRIVDIDTAPDGSLYYLLRPLEGIYPGGIFKASFNSTSPGAPSISEQPQNKVGSLGQPVTFSVAASGNEPLNYQWQRNGVNIQGATQPNYTLPAVAQADDGAQFRVVVTNAVGSVTSSAATLSVTTNQPPVPTITLPAAGATFSAGDTINFAGSATDPEDGVLPASAFTWRVDLYHADTPETQHAHPVLAPTAGSKTGSVVADLAGHYETTIWMRVTLTVKDSAGLEATTFADVQPNKVTMTLGTSAPGLRLNLDGTPVRTPAPVPAVVGVPRLLGAPATQTVNGVTYQFDGWSDAGAAEHPVNVPATDATYTANYHALDDGSANPPDSPDLTIAFAQPIAESALAGTTAKTKVKLTNAGATPLSGAAGVGLFLSPDEFLDPEDPAVATLPKNLVIKPGKSKTISVPFTIPDTIVAGSYRLLAWADPGKTVAEKNEANNVAVSGAIAVGPATRDFSVAVNGVTLKPGPAKRGLATLLLHYDGNLPANGPLGIELRASADTTPDSSDALVATITRKVKLKPGASKLLKVKFPATSLAAGAYYLTAAVDTANAFAESNEANNTAVSGTTFTVA